MAYFISTNVIISDTRFLSNVSITAPNFITAFSNGLLSSNSLVAGSTNRTLDATLYTLVGAGTGTIRADWNFAQRGIVRFSFDVSTSSAANPGGAYLYRVRDGSNTTVFDGRTTSTTVTTLTTDQGVLPGDYFMAAVVGNSTATGRLSNIALQTSSDTYYLPFSHELFGGVLTAVT